MTPEPPLVSQQIREAGWRQGGLVVPGDHEAIFTAAVDYCPFAPGDSIQLIVITQICDLVRDVETEPYVELIVGHDIDKPNPLYQNGRNPRILHVPLYAKDIVDAKAWLNISIHDRVRIPKDALEHRSPNTELSLHDEDVHLLRRWIAKRYIRPAFPDAFNNRLTVMAKSLEKLWKSAEARLVTGVYLRTTDEELVDDAPYSVHVHITANASVWDEISDVDLLNVFEERFSHILDACEGIVLADDDIRTLPEEDFTLADLRAYKRLDKDYRSLPEQSGVEGPPQGIDAEC